MRDISASLSPSSSSPYLIHRSVCSRANWAHFLIAGIGGAVVGLFSNFTISQGASISPLAIAFLVGYGVDVFFSFLEGLMQSFTKGKTANA